jgi:hypothetical protein
MSEYAVVCPVSEPLQAVRPAPRTLDDLDGLTIGELSNYQFHSGFTFDVIKRALLARYPRLKFVPFEAFGNIDDPNREAEIVRGLPEKLRLYECDAVITGNGG